MNTINPDVLTFYKSLSENNNRKWFENEKSRFKSLELEVKAFNNLIQEGKNRNRNR